MWSNHPRLCRGIWNLAVKHTGGWETKRNSAFKNLRELISLKNQPPKGQQYLSRSQRLKSETPERSSVSSIVTFGSDVRCVRTEEKSSKAIARQCQSILNLSAIFFQKKFRKRIFFKKKLALQVFFWKQNVFARIPLVSLSDLRNQLGPYILGNKAYTTRDFFGWFDGMEWRSGIVCFNRLTSYT